MLFFSQIIQKFHKVYMSCLVCKPYRLSCLLSIIFIISDASAQQIGSWKIYPAYTVSTSNVPAGHRIYSIMEGKLMAYDVDDGSITTFDWQKHLSDVTVNFIRYNAESKRLIIIYDNGNIDLLSTEDDSDVINLAQLKNSTMINKDVNYVQSSGRYAYICTGFGIVVVDMVDGIIRDSYELGLSVKSCALSQKNMFLGTTTGLWRGTLTDNLKDKANWKQLNKNIQPQHMETFDGHVWIHWGYDLFLVNEDESTWKTLLSSALKPVPEYMTVNANKLIIGTTSKIYIYEGYDKDPTEVSGTFSWTCLSARGNEYWASDGNKGLQAYRLTNGEFQLTTSGIHPNSPLHDYSLYLNRAGNDILVAGGNRNYETPAREGTSMILYPDGSWTNFDVASAQKAFPNERYRDVTSVVQDPNDASHYYAGTSRSGIFEFRNAVCTGHIGLDNSPLKSILPTAANPQYFVSADGLKYDSEGNLWMLNCTEGKETASIRILKNNGSWAAIPCAEIEDASTVDKIMFDSRGWAWLNSRRMGQRGVFILNYNGTIDNTADDRRRLFTTIVNQDGTSYTPDNFFCTAEDIDGSVWIGTELGPFVARDVENFQSSNYTFEQVKIARNDGSGLADYLFNNISIRSIAVDGAGRKWFGTENNGVYLVSEDCQEQIYHFNTENSLLPSDLVTDILIHPTTGVVYFATGKGLCSFASDATAPSDELDKDEVYAFPNPVDPDYNGPIAVRGLVKDCEVKIVSPTGQLVWSGQSKGGTFTWNGRNQSGKRPASGIYTVIASTPDGEEAVATRITIIR